MTRLPFACSSFLVKVLIVAVAVMLGSAGGVYVGHSLSSSKQTAPAKANEESSANPAWMHIKEGDAFPLEEYNDTAGTSRSFESLLFDKETIVIFTSWGCEPCLDLLRYASDKMLARLKPGVQVVLIIEASQGHVPDEFAGYVRGMKQAFVNGDYWRLTYHAVTWPTIVGVDNSGIIRHIQFGYDGAIDHKLVKYFFSLRKNN